MEILDLLFAYWQTFPYSATSQFPGQGRTQGLQQPTKHTLSMIGVNA
jgi:hypothetical protein